MLRRYVFCSSSSSFITFSLHHHHLFASSSSSSKRFASSLSSSNLGVNNKKEEEEFDSVIQDFLDEDLEDVQQVQRKQQQSYDRASPSSTAASGAMMSSSTSTLISEPKPTTLPTRKVVMLKDAAQNKKIPAPPKAKQEEYLRLKTNTAAAAAASNSSISARNSVSAAKTAQSSGGLVSQFAPVSSSSTTSSSSSSSHSLSEFLTATIDLVTKTKEAKTEELKRAKLQEAESFWRQNVAKTIEMNCRCTHDLACVARAGRGLGFTITTSKSLNNNNNNNTTTTTTTLDLESLAVYSGWSMIPRYQHVTGCEDAMNALCLLIRSQPPLPPAPSPYQSIDDDQLAPKYKTFCDLHSHHQKLAMEHVRYFFVVAAPHHQQNNNNNNNERNLQKQQQTFSCPRNDFESIVDCLAILDSFSNSKRKLLWPSPPKHINAKFWENTANVMKYALPTCSEVLSFSQLVDCLSKCKRLFISCNYAIFEEDEEEHKIDEKLSRIRNGNNNSNNNDKKSETVVRVSDKARATRRHVKRALRNARQEIVFSGAVALLKQIVAQTVSLEKLVNSYHFSMIVDAIYVMNLHQFASSAAAVPSNSATASANNEGGENSNNKRLMIVSEALEVLGESFRQKVEIEKRWKFDEKEIVKMKKVLFE